MEAIEAPDSMVEAMENPGVKTWLQSLVRLPQSVTVTGERGIAFVRTTRKPMKTAEISSERNIEVAGTLNGQQGADVAHVDNGCWMYVKLL
jgi:hypothetical protein